MFWLERPISEETMRTRDSVAGSSLRSVLFQVDAGAAQRSTFGWSTHKTESKRNKNERERERERERRIKKKKNYIQCDCHFRLFCLPLASVHARPRVKPPSSDSCFNSVITVAQIRIRNTASATRLMTVIHLPLLWWPIFPITEPLSNFPTLRPVHLPSSRSIIAGLSWFLANIRAEIGPNRRVWLTLASIVWHLPFYLIDL